MESPGDPRNFQGVVGNPRKSKELSEHPRRPWERLGGSRKLLEIRGGSRKSQGIRSHEWRSQVVPGDPRGRGPCESRGDMKEFQGISGKPLGSPREPRKSQGILGNPRKSKELGNSKETLGTLRSFQQIDGNSMRSQEISGIRSHDRRSQEVLGDLRGSQEFRGDPMTPRGNLGHAWRS